MSPISAKRNHGLYSVQSRRNDHFLKSAYASRSSRRSALSSSLKSVASVQNRLLLSGPALKSALAMLRDKAGVRLGDATATMPGKSFVETTQAVLRGERTLIESVIRNCFAAVFSNRQTGSTKASNSPSSSRRIASLA